MFVFVLNVNQTYNLLHLTYCIEIIYHYNKTTQFKITFVFISILKSASLVLFSNLNKNILMNSMPKYTFILKDPKSNKSLI